MNNMERVISSLLLLIMCALNRWQVLSMSAKVDVTIHYQLLCTHSRAIVIEQAIPAWRKLSQLMNLELVPYGNTRTILINNSTVPPLVRFECQNGNTQCEGNMLMACALSTLPKEYGFGFVECVYKHKLWFKPSISAKECAYKLNIDWQFLSICSNSTQGTTIQWLNGVKLKKLKPRYSTVPWILIENRHSAEQDKQAFDNMMQLVCDKYRGLKPAICNDTEIEEVFPSQIGFTSRNISELFIYQPNNESIKDDYKLIHGISPNNCVNKTINKNSLDISGLKETTNTTERDV